MSDGDLRNFYNRTQSTYYYSFDSTCGKLAGNGVYDGPGKFSMTIQPFSFPQHNSSQRAVFTLHSMYIVGQDTDDGVALDANDRASGSLAFDCSGFYLIGNGLGFANNQFVTSKVCSKAGSNGFFIANKDAGAVNADSAIYQAVSGDEFKGPSFLCSNPAGTNIVWEVIDANTGDQIVDTEVYKTIVNFSIQIIPDEITANN